MTDTAERPVEGAPAPVDETPTGPKFTDLALKPEVQKAIQSIGYETPSPIQEQAIPPILEGRDLLGVAQTGTGKTAAFALPVLSTLDIKNRNVQVLVLAPTRELAIQVAEAFHTYAKFLKGFKVLPIYGGTDYGHQIRSLREGVQVVVGTPGRVMDHIEKGTFKLDNIHTLVLDEGDEMLRMGFIDDVQWILDRMPEEHQTALFSATMPPAIKKITQKYLKDPAEITIKVKTTTAPTIRQQFVFTRNMHEKMDTLTRLFDVEEYDAVLVFVRTKNATMEVAEHLTTRGFSAEALNGDLTQSKRERVIAQLKAKKLDIIVATDVAARGLDVDRVSHVINYDIPFDTESYVHRIGRTGRAGREGDAILFVNGRERSMLANIERKTRQKIERYHFPSVDVLNERKLNQTFARLDEELKRELKDYTGVIKKYQEANPDVDPLRIAAAFASIQADGQPFYVLEPTKPPKRDNDKRDREFDRDKMDRMKRDGGGDNHRSDAGMESYRLDVGKIHGATKGDIVGAIANEAGLNSSAMGKIRVFDEHSFIDLPDGMPKEIFKALKQVRVRGRKMGISKDGTKNRRFKGTKKRFK